MTQLSQFLDLHQSWIRSEDLAINVPEDAFSLFETIPPERVGLNGEYDHSGLAKRVRKVLEQEYEPDQISELIISQRGRVVVLSGKMSHQNVLQQVINTVLKVSGTWVVETYGLRVQAN